MAIASLAPFERAKLNLVAGKPDVNVVNESGFLKSVPQKASEASSTTGDIYLGLNLRWYFAYSALLSHR